MGKKFIEVYENVSLFYKLSKLVKFFRKQKEREVDRVKHDNRLGR